MSDKSNLPTVLSHITEYLDSGGLWNPERADYAAVRDLIRDARDEIDRLRQRNRQIDDEAYEYAEQIEQLKAAAKDSADHYADARAEINRLTRILAALREPSEIITDAFFEEYWNTANPANAFRAAVDAAEQEVGGR